MAMARWESLVWTHGIVKLAHVVINSGGQAEDEHPGLDKHTGQGSCSSLVAERDEDYWNRGFDHGKKIGHTTSAGHWHVYPYP